MLAFDSIPSLIEARAITKLMKQYSNAKAWISFCCKVRFCPAVKIRENLIFQIHAEFTTRIYSSRKFLLIDFFKFSVGEVNYSVEFITLYFCRMVSTRPEVKDLQMHVIVWLTALK